MTSAFDLSRLLGPTAQRAPSADMLAGLPHGVMVVACMEASFRRREGWLGLSLCESRPDSFTCRLKIRPGVFGLMPVGVETGQDAPEAIFAVCYFPGPDDLALADFSAAARQCAAAPDFSKRVRDFAADEAFAGLFAIGEMRLVLRVADVGVAGLALTFAAERARRVLVPHPEPVWTHGRGQSGACWDGNLAAFDLGRPVLRVFAAGLAVALGARPDAVALTETKSLGWALADNDTLVPVDDPDAFIDRDTAIWGSTAVWTCAPFDGPASRPRALADPEAWLSPQREVADDADRPRLLVLTGFLGSGKTSFLNQFIEYHAGRSELVTVVQNELGEKSVDHLLTEGDESVLTVDAGCVCCTLATALAGSVRQLRDRFHPDVIVLETTGLANPLNMVESLHDLEDMVTLDAVVTVIDAPRYRETIARSELAEGQVAAADTIVLNKCDLVDEATLAAIRDDLARRNPEARILTAEFGRVHPNALKGGLGRLAAHADAAAVANAVCDHHDHHHGGHDHDGTVSTHLAEGYGFLRLALPREVDRNTLDRLLDAAPSTIDRVKGLVRFAGEDHARIVQFVPGQSEVVEPARQEDGEPFLIVIGRGVDTADCRAFWQPILEVDHVCAH